MKSGMSPGESRSAGRRDPAPQVAILLGSGSDLPVIEQLPALLERFGLTHIVAIASAHRQPERLRRLVRDLDRRGVSVYIAVAGMAAHLPGVVAAQTLRPVIGVPVAAGSLGGLDALLSMVQMPPGVPVATVALGSAGARNAAVLAARILALQDQNVAERLEAYRRELARRGK
jgi:phosphoribosylaminoimidazole carboxylase PurE protein